jgi:hypothetical protein
MRFMVTVRWDIDKGNELVRNGTLGSTVESILEDLQPEAAYFRADQGHRSAILFVHLDDASQIPSVAEPWFLAVNATVQFEPVMAPEDLQKAGPSIDAAAKRFG